MQKAFILTNILLITLAMSLNAGVNTRIIKPAPLPAYTIESLNKAKTKGNLNNIDKWPKLTPVWSKLEKADILIKFKKAVELPSIGIGKLGWNWAVPKVVGISVNGGKEIRYELKSPRLTPLSKKIEVSIISLSTQPVKSLRIRVINIQTPYNKFGVLKVVLPKFAATKINLPQQLPANAAGIRLSVTKRDEFKNITIKAFAKRFGKDIFWEYPLTNLVDGENEIFIRWNQFHSSDYPAVSMLQENVYQLEIPRELNLVRWQFLDDSNQENKPVWEQLQKLTFAADKNGWRPGIPRNGFGRFGYVPTNGLLTGVLAPNNFTYRIEDKGHGNVLHLGIECGPSGQDNSWQRFNIDWTGVVVSQLKKTSRKNSDGTLSKAYGVYDKSRLPENFIYSSLVPGFLVKSHDKKIRLISAEKDGAPWILYRDKNNDLVWTALEKGFDPQKMIQGWCIISWKSKKKLPILLSFQQRPKAFTVNGKILEISFAKAMGYLGVGTPAGYRGWSGTIGTLDKETMKLAKKSTFLASVLRAYPISCDMQFLDNPNKIRFKESFGYICWNNEWKEEWTKITPVPPLISFAKKMDYPVEWPNGIPVDTGIDTKYGPYYISQGEYTEYSLPLPDYDETFYLRPTGEDKLIDKFTKKMTLYLVNRKVQPATNALGCWWMFAPSSLALPLWSEEQRNKIISSWKLYMKRALSSRAWYLRTEPFSGTKYMVSFAWLDRKMEILGDPNSGNGGTLYGLWAYARTTGDWDLLDKNWDMIKGILQYFLVCHDWTMLQTGCREHSASSSCDMDGAAYQGAAAFLHMATTLNKKDDIAVGRMMLSRLALSTVTRWRGMSWKQPGSSQKQWDAISLGLCENRGFDCMDLKYRSPNNLHGHLALSLSWIGEYPMLYNLHLWGCGKEFWKTLEYDWLEKKLPDWRKNYPGYLSFHYSTVLTHLYMRACLGEKQSQLRTELDKQINKKGKKWFFEPDTRQAAEQAPFYALYFGGDFPASIRSWGKAILKSAEYKQETKTAVIVLDSQNQDVVKLDFKVKPKSGTVNSKKILSLNVGKNIFKIPPGKSTITIKF